MASGVPAVAARAGGIPELVEDGVNGFLFDPGDVEAAAAAVRRCLDRQSYPLGAGWGDTGGPRSRLALGARGYAERHDWNAATTQLRGLYRSVIGSNRKTAAAA
jgi:glycosyltransferase involved in cell wall biosynthesis